MRLRAYYTVENSVIIPLFTIIIVAIILTGLIVHDINIINIVTCQSAIRLENNRNNGKTDEENAYENSEVINTATEFINEKTMIKNVSYDEIYKTSKDKMSNNKKQSSMIRKINVFRELSRN